MPFILLAMIGFAMGANSFIPLECKAFLYAVSLSLKEVIITILPALIFGLLFKTAVQLSKSASKMIVALLSAVCISNFISTLMSFSAGKIAYTLDLSMAFAIDNGSLNPAWEIAIPRWIGNDIAMFSGLIIGMLLANWKHNWAERILPQVERYISLILKLILAVLPLFMLGFVIKICHDQQLTHILQNYAQVFFIVSLAVFGYIIFINLCCQRFVFNRAYQSIINMLPAAVAGFGSMSSAAAMPLTLIGAEKNSHQPDLARALIPATVNIHLIGDCFAIPIFAFAVLKNLVLQNLCLANI
jgi:hypothetical protein